MADINAMIAQGGAPLQLENPLNQMAKVYAIKQAQMQNTLAEQQQRQMLAEEEAYRTAGTDMNRLPAELMSRGLGRQALAVTAQQQKAQADRVKMLKDRADLMKTEATAVMANPTLENAIARVQAYSANVGVDPTPALGELQRLGDNPDAIRQWAAGYAVEADKLLPKFQQFAQPGVGVVTGTVSPLTGGFTPGQTFAEQIGPAERERLRIAAGQLSVAQAAEARQAEEAAQRDNVIARTVTDEAGRVRFFNRFGREVSPSTAQGAPAQVQGKPSAAFEKTRAQQQQLNKDLALTITELERVSKNGGLIDQSTGSGIGRGVDIAAGMVGKATPGAIAAAKLKPIADMALKLVPRFEGPQSDKDTQSYKEAAGQLANESLPNEIRKEAAKEIVRLMKARRSQFVTQDMAANATPSAAAKPALTVEDRQALDWANANPADPRAAAIKQRLGAQ